MIPSKRRAFSPFPLSFSALFIQLFIMIALQNVESALSFTDFHLYLASLSVEVLIYLCTYLYLLKRENAYGFKLSFANLSTGIYLWIVIIFISAIYIYLLGFFGVRVEPSQYSLLKIGRTDFEKAFVIFSAIFIAPFIEEAFFRGCLFPAIKQRFGYLYALIGSSLIFGFLHGFPYFFQTAVFGILLAYLAEKNRSLDVSVLLHILNNFVSILTVFIF